MASVSEVARIGLRVIFESVETTEGIDNVIRTVHRESVTIEGDSSFVSFILGGAVTIAVVGATAHFLKKYFGDRGRPLAPNCVIYEVTIPKSKKKKFEKYVTNGSFKKDLQTSFDSADDQLRQVLGDEYSKVELENVEYLKKTKITSVELCDQQTLLGAWRKFWQIQERKMPAAKQVTLKEKVKMAFEGKISELKLSNIIKVFHDLGVDSSEDVALLRASDIAKQLERVLTLVEIRKLTEFLKGHEIPLPPSSLRLSSAEYPNTALTVFFDDPNKMSCEYMVTARDMVSAEEISVESDANFGVLKNLQPGRRYVIYAQCISNDVKSKKTFFSEPINVFGGKGDTEGMAEISKNPIEQMKGVPSVPTITDSAYQSEKSGTASGRGLGDDEASVLTKSEIQFGEEADANIELTEDLQPLWKSHIHEEFKNVFPGMGLTRMKDLLKKCADMGMQRIEDLRYLKDQNVAEELKGTLKIVELKKLLEYVKDEYMHPGSIAIGNQSRGYRHHQGTSPWCYPGIRNTYNTGQNYPGNESGVVITARNISLGEMPTKNEED